MPLGAVWQWGQGRGGSAVGWANRQSQLNECKAWSSSSVGSINPWSTLIIHATCLLLGGRAIRKRWANRIQEVLGGFVSLCPLHCRCVVLQARPILTSARVQWVSPQTAAAMYVHFHMSFFGSFQSICIRSENPLKWILSYQEQRPPSTPRNWRIQWQVSSLHGLSMNPRGICHFKMIWVGKRSVPTVTRPVTWYAIEERNGLNTSYIQKLLVRYVIGIVQLHNHNF
jgi:hypothetical protein